MATVEEVDDNNSTQNGHTFEVITLSSDEEEDNESSDDPKYVFDRFILACRQHVAQEALTAAREVFKAAPKDLICSKEITEMLKRSTKLVNKENASRFVDELCEGLKNGNVVKRSTDINNSLDDGHARSTCFASDVTKARDFKEISSEAAGINGGEDMIAEISDDEVDFVREVHTERPDNMPSTSSAHHHRDDDIKFPKTGKMATKDLTTRQKKRLGMRLKRRLKEISQEIKILNKSELTLDEMEMADSNYIKENRLKKKFDKTWNKLCKILGRPPKTGRVIEKSVRPSSTGYTIIDKAIEKFMHDKQGKFPDFFDIRDVVLKTNEIHDLRMAPQVLRGIIADVFTDIGNKLQRLREKDLVFNFGSHLLDNFKTDEDPALVNDELLEKLEKNRRISRKKLKQVYAKYTHLERYGKTGNRGATSTDPDVQHDDDVESDDTTTDDEEETNKTMTGVTSTSMSDEEDLASHTPSSPLRNGEHPTVSVSDTEDNSIDNATKTVEYVSLDIEGDSMDCTEPNTTVITIASTCTLQNDSTSSTEDDLIDNATETTMQYVSLDVDDIEPNNTDYCTLKDDLTSNTEDDLIDIAPETTMQYVSLDVGSSVDDIEPNTVLNNDSASACTEANIQTENDVETPLENSDDSPVVLLNDDCCIIDNPEENTSPMIVNQTKTSPPTPPEKPSLSSIIERLNNHVRTSQARAGEVTNHVKKGEVNSTNHVRTGKVNSRKRKLQAVSRVEELVSALKRKKLKAPNSMTEVSTSVSTPETLFSTNCVNGTSPTQITEEQHIEQNEDSEGTFNGVSTSEVQMDEIVEHSFECKPDMTLLLHQRGRNGLPKLTSNGHTRTTVNHQITSVVSSNGTEKVDKVMHDVIIIDD